MKTLRITRKKHGIKKGRYMMKVLVTGGAGFIGSNFIYYMRKVHPDYEIVNLDALTYCGNVENLTSLEQDEKYHFVHGRIEDGTLVNQLFATEQFDMVVNFAAQTHVDRSLLNPAEFTQTNIVGTQTLLEACRKYGVQRFHQVSTDEVYGDLPLEDKTAAFDEESKIKPSSPYSASKAGADMLVLAYGRSFDLNVTVSRCSNNYGAYQFPEKLIPLVISRAMHEEQIPIYGDGQNVRDWLHVEDHCSAIDLILHKGRSGEVYNVGGKNEYSNLALVEIILKSMGKSKELITFTKDRSGHDRRYAINPAKIEQELGWKPRYTFETGIEETINWYLTHQEWIEKLLTRDYQDVFKKINAHMQSA